MPKKKIKIACREPYHTAHIDELRDFQGNLKTLSETNYKKLKEGILKLGFSEPVSVWSNGGTKFILNGHQRVLTLRQMVTEGYECPDIPINYITAKNEAEAKRKVLALTSQYGEITHDGLYEFLSESNINYSELGDFNFPEVKVDKFIKEFYEPTDEEQHPDVGAGDKEWLVVANCQNEEEQADIYNDLTDRGIKCKIMS